MSHNSCPCGSLNSWKIFCWTMCSCERNVDVYRKDRQRCTHGHGGPRKARSRLDVHQFWSQRICLFSLMTMEICLGHSDVNVYTWWTLAWFLWSKICVHSFEWEEGWCRLIYCHQQECETCHRHPSFVLKLGTRFNLSAVCACSAFSSCMLVRITCLWMPGYVKCICKFFYLIFSIPKLQQTFTECLWS